MKVQRASTEAKAAPVRDATRATLARALAAARTVSTRIGPWRQALAGQVLAFWLLTRAIYAAITYFAIALPISSTGGVTLATTKPPAPGWFFNVWHLWDGWFYESIARNGYTRPIDASFFPLYPLLVHGLASVFQGDYTLAGMVVSAGGSFLAFLGVAMLAQQEGAPIFRTTRLFAAFPLAFFLTSLYADGLFISLCAFTLLFARRGVWTAAALCGFLACLTRPVGSALFLPLLYEYGRQTGLWRHVAALPHSYSRELLDTLGDWYAWYVRQTPRSIAYMVCRTALVILAIPLAYLIYSAYCLAQYGDALAWQHSQTLFGRATEWPWQGLALALRQLFAAPVFSVVQARVLMDVAPVLLVLVVTLASVRRQPLAFTLLSLGVLWLSLSAPEIHVIFPDALAASGRHMLTALPVFLMLGRVAQRWPTLDMLAFGVGFALQALFLVYIANGGWII